MFDPREIADGSPHVRHKISYTAFMKWRTARDVTEMKFVNKKNSYKKIDMP